MKKLSILILFLFITTCKNEKPEIIAPGTVPCEFCAMHITDMKFHTQIISAHGKHFHFDSIECALDWKKNHEEESVHLWTTDFTKKNMIKMNEAYYLHSAKRQSPMKSGYSAYATKEEVETAKSHWEGKVLTFTELVSQHRSGNE